MKRQILLFTLITFLFSCSDEKQTVDMRINHHYNTGTGVGLYLTMMVQEDNEIGGDNWYRFYDKIDGFNYVPGFIYDIEVRVDNVNNPPEDGSSLKYSLLSIKSTTKVSNDVTFNMDLKTNNTNFISTTNNEYSVLNKVVIDCNDLCNQLDLKLQNEDFVIGTFKHTETNKIQLIELN